MEWDAAIHALLRTLATHGSTNFYTLAEKELVLTHFPRTAAAVGAAKWRTREVPRLDARLETLRAGIASLDRGAGEGPVWGSSEGARQTAELCVRLSRLRGDANYLGLLWRDQYDVIQMAPRTHLAEIIGEKYRARLDVASHELEGLRLEVRKDPAFRGSACVTQN
jgi:hypothetical protein